MSFMTKLEGVADTDQVKEGMAFFEGTGPEGKTCGGCIHRGYARFRAPKWSEDAKDFVEKSYRVTSCALFKAMSGEHGPSVNKDWKACKYWSEAYPLDIAREVLPQAMTSPPPSPDAK